MTKIKINIEKTHTGYSAFAERYPVATTGKDLIKLKKNIVDALNLYFEKKSQKIGEENLRIYLDLPQFFEFYKIINAKALSENIGMNQSLLAQYIKGHKKPSANQVNRILKGIHQIGKELAEIRFIA
ncbi:MAG: XRE family transcriptional regulator [Bacteroidetes bacterium]|nr:MAG: XRE family transcriptional regulator [Bacteroidota bacterium]